MARDKDVDQIMSRCKALIALFPYAAWRGRGGDHRMFYAYSDIFVVPKARRFVGGPITALLDEESPNSPNWVVTLILPYINWESKIWGNKNAVTRWGAEVLAAPYTEKLGRSVVHTLLRIAYNRQLLPFIPADVWALLKKQPSLPPIREGWWMETEGHIICRVREFRDVELLKSYFLLVWSEWDYVCSSSLREMRTSIREDLGGIEMWHHRAVLVKRLDHILRQLDKGLEHLKQHKPSLGEYYIAVARARYGSLKNVLLKVDREALTRTPFRSITIFDLLTPPRMPTESHSTFICALPLPCP